MVENCNTTEDPDVTPEYAQVTLEDPEITPEDAEVTIDEENVCKNCGSPSVVEGYSIPLCQECRQKLTNYPIPIAIKIFSTIVFAILIFSLISFPKSLNAGIAYERGLRAENENKFTTAAKEYRKVTDIFPGSFIAGGKLFVAYVKSHQFEEADEAFKLIEGKNSSNSDEIKVIDQANEAISILDAYYNIDQKLADIINQQSDAPLQTLSDKLKEYTEQFPNDYWGFYYFAGTLFDLEMYEEAKAAYIKGAALNPDIYELRLGAAAVYRQTGEFDKAIAECNAVLDSNVEYADAYASLSKIDFKRHQYESALQSARAAYDYDNSNTNAICTLALACHFNDMTAERDSLLDILKDKDNYYYVYAKDIIDGKSLLFE